MASNKDLLLANILLLKSSNLKHRSFALFSPFLLRFQHNFPLLWIAPESRCYKTKLRVALATLYVTQALYLNAASQMTSLNQFKCQHSVQHSYAFVKFGFDIGSREGSSNCIYLFDPFDKVFNYFVQVGNRIVNSGFMHRTRQQFLRFPKLFSSSSFGYSQRNF